jgi:hypothetical protein
MSETTKKAEASHKAEGTDEKMRKLFDRNQLGDLTFQFISALSVALRDEDLELLEAIHIKRCETLTHAYERDNNKSLRKLENSIREAISNR